MKLIIALRLINLKWQLHNINEKILTANQSIKSIIILMALITMSADTYASHLMGSDITWKYISYNKFEITLKLYRDCRGVALGQSVNLYSTCKSTLINSNNIIRLNRTGWKYITPTCSQIPDLCGTPGNRASQGKGVEEHTYVNILDFNTGDLKLMMDEGCCEFIFEYKECCRNNAITTGSKGQSIYTDAMINICNIDKSGKPGFDNGPAFLNPPVVNVCCNQMYHYNNGVIETDGDSLSFSLTSAKQTIDNNVNYINPYGSNWPMTAYCSNGQLANCPCIDGKNPADGICFNNYNGDFSFYPTNCNEVGVMVVKVDQYRLNKEKTEWLHIGYNKRDIQIYTEVCNNNAPVLKPSEQVSICEGDSFCMEIIAEDKEIDFQFWEEIISLSWNQGLPGASFDIKEPELEIREDGKYAIRKAEICWETQIGDGKETPYFFTVIAKDNGCPVNLSTSVSYSVIVNKQVKLFESTICLKTQDSADLNQYFNSPRTAKWSVYAINGDTDYYEKDQWISEDFKYFLYYKGTGIFELTPQSTYCFDKETAIINVFKNPDFNLFPFDTVCSSGEPIKLNSDFNFSENHTEIWEGFGVTLIKDTFYFYPDSSLKEKEFEGPYQLNCNITDTISSCYHKEGFSVIIQTQPDVRILTTKPYEQCEFNPFNLNVDLKNTNSIRWYATGDGVFDDEYKSNPVYFHGISDTNTGNIWVYVQTDANDKCPMSMDSINLLIYSYPQAELFGFPLTGCQPLSVDFKSVILKPDIQDLIFEWDFGNGVNSNQIQNENIIYSNPAKYDVYLKLANKKGDCSTLIVKPQYIQVLHTPAASFSTNPENYTSLSKSKIKMINNSSLESGQMSFYWDFGTVNTGDNSTEKHPEIYYSRFYEDTMVYNIWLYVTSENGCIDSAMKIMRIGPDVTIFIPNAFSPGEYGPDLNNKFYVISNGVKDFHLMIFNRWGEQLWETRDRFEGWDGSFKGEKCINDVYIYFLNITGFDEEVYEYSGTISLIRE